ncbi:MAG: hypothetical protein JWR84_4222 [Caulobacter sp.]|nr:hypothetical protein [Caulobacter sp.]
MSISRSVAVAMAALLFSASAAPVAMAQNGASPRAGYAAVSFCNKTSGNVYLAVSYREAPGSDSWVVEGWKKIGGASCITLNLPNDGMVYDYAEDETDGDWGGDFKLCVERPGPFKRINTAEYTCITDLLEGFGETDITGLSSKTINYNP